jgi:hypothetical protein
MIEEMGILVDGIEKKQSAYRRRENHWVAA